jgi:hypothetical protein
MTESAAIAIDYNPAGVYNFSHTRRKTNGHTLLPRISVNSCPRPFTYPHPTMSERPEVYRCTGHSRSHLIPPRAESGQGTVRLMLLSLPTHYEYVVCTE